MTPDRTPTEPGFWWVKVQSYDQYHFYPDTMFVNVFVVTAGVEASLLPNKKSQYCRSVRQSDC
jgi:hypothetical protein